MSSGQQLYDAPLSRGLPPLGPPLITDLRNQWHRRPFIVPLRPGDFWKPINWNICLARAGLEPTISSTIGSDHTATRSRLPFYLVFYLVFILYSVSPNVVPLNFSDKSYKMPLITVERYKESKKSRWVLQFQWQVPEIREKSKMAAAITTFCKITPKLRTLCKIW